MEPDDRSGITEAAPLMLDNSGEVTMINPKILVIFAFSKLKKEEKEKESKEGCKGRENGGGDGGGDQRCDLLA
jgi:hypothetical protein